MTKGHGLPPEITAVLSAANRFVREVQGSDLHERIRRWGAPIDELCKAVDALTEWAHGETGAYERGEALGCPDCAAGEVHVCPFLLADRWPEPRRSEALEHMRSGGEVEITPQWWRPATPGP